MKCEFCASDFVRKETYRAHIVSHHKRHLSEREYEDVLDRIKKFQPPSLDINRFTLEKQADYQPVDSANDVGEETLMLTELDEEDVGGLEVIEQDSQDRMEVEGEFFEDSELYEEEQ